MAEESSSLAWLNMRVPMWTIFLAVAGTGATSVAGGSWRWLENNEPRFSIMAERMAVIDSRTLLIEQSNAEMKASYGRDHEALKADLIAAIAEFRTELSKKVDDGTRRDMANALNDRITQMERHIEMNSTRINSIIDRMVEYPKGGRLGANTENGLGHSYTGMDATNLSGHGSASAIAYSRKIRDRLQPVI